MFALLHCIEDEKHNTLGSSLDIDSLVISEENNVSQSLDISSEDVSCVACSQLLFRPVVLSCGHGMLVAYDLCLASKYS